MDIADVFRNASPEELKNGYVELDGYGICLLCGKVIENDTPENEMQVHVAQSHGSEFGYLVQLEKMKQVVGLFEMNRIYNEKEINAIIKEIDPDYATLRRYLIDFGIMERKIDGSQYWLKK
jgi:hypothetical protein